MILNKVLLIFTLLKICSCDLLDPVQDVVVDDLSLVQDIEQRPVNGVSLNDPFQLVKETLITQALSVVQEDYGKKLLSQCRVFSLDINIKCK